MSRGADLSLFTTVDDELYDELSELVDQKVVHAAVWEESLVDALSHEEPTDAPTVDFDLDLYLEDGVYFELYGVQFFSDLESEPWAGLETVTERLVALINRGLWLIEVAVDEQDGLVLVLGYPDRPALYLTIGGWLIEEWDELPER
jgi:hypothetical protein